mgnify:CR=1 FL=1
MSEKRKLLTAIVPCYNEEEALPFFYAEISRVAAEMQAVDFEFLFINDGSKDGTLRILRELALKDKRVRYVSFSRNFGKESAMFAGFEHAKGDYIAVMDADLQDDIDVIDKFVDEYYNGSQIVYGVRKSRKTDTFFKRTTAIAFYKLMRMMGVELVYNHADYRLMSKRAVEELEQYKEVNLFLRGLVPLIGFESSVVEYDRGKRYAGESKYPLKKMIFFAIDGITSTSVKPIRMITALGFITAFISVIFLIYVIIGHLIGHTVLGWTTIIVLVCLFGGMQIMCIGIVGEYVGKIYLETKKRPRYIVEEKKLK